MLKPHLRAYQQQLRQAMNRGLAQAGPIALNTVRQEMLGGFASPIRRSGKLYASMDCHAEDGQLHVGSNLPYAAMVHEGTSSMEGRPFLAKGMEKAGEEMAEAICAEIEKV